MHRNLTSNLLLRGTAAITLSVVALAGMSPASALGDPPELPEAEDLLDKHVEAIGGADAHGALTTRRKSGTLAVDMVGHAFEAKIEEHYLAPDKSHTLIDGGFFHQVDVCDGESAWQWRPGHHGDGTHPEEDPDSGATELLEGHALASALAKARFAGPVEWRERFTSAKTIGVADVEGEPAYEVALITKDGEQLTQFYDQASGLLVQRVTTARSELMGDLDMTVSFQDYREFDGIRMATRIHAVLSSPTAGEGTQTWTYTEIVHGEEIPPSLFEMPGSLRADGSASGHATSKAR